MLTLATGVVLAFALYLLGLSVAAFVRPALVERVLGAFAGSARAHGTELVVRLALGGALVLAAPAARWPAGLAAFGWLLVATTVGMAAVPWRWHRRFAQTVVPPVLRHVRFLGVGAGALGLLLGWAVLA